MKLTKSEAQKIADLYNLGKIKKLKTIKGGWVNFNFDIKTEKGNFILRFIGGREFKSWKIKKLKFEFRVLEYLKQRNFPYQIPIPIKDKKGEKINVFKKRGIWIYKKLEGICREEYNLRLFKEVVKVMATYHNYIKNFKDKRESDFDDYKWFFRKYKKLRKVKPKNKTDKLMLNHVDFFEDLLKKISKINFGKKIAIHSDFHIENVLYKNKKAISLIDFDNIEFAPKSNDLAVFVGDNCMKKNKLVKTRYKTMLKEYRKISKLSKKEEQMIIPLAIRYYCVLFWWFYAGMEKNQHLRHWSIKGAIEKAQDLVKYWEGKKGLK